MKKFGGPNTGDALPEWSMTDDGLGMLSGTLKVFIDGDGKVGGAVRGGVGGVNALGGSTASGSAGSITGSNKYSGNNGLSNPKGQSSGGLGAGIPKKGDVHPFEPRLKCFGVTINRTSLGYGYAEAQYVGLLQDPAGIEWEVSGSTEEDAIETHPNFLYKSKFPVSNNKYSGEAQEFEVVTKEGINPNTKGPYWNLKNVHIDGPTQAFKGFRASERNIEKRLVGVESYKVPRATYRVSFTTQKESKFSWALSSLGRWCDKIPSMLDAPLTPSVTKGKTTTLGTSIGQYASTVARKSTANWLLTSVSVSQASGLYKVSIEFMLSGAYGWNPIIYKKLDEKMVEEMTSNNYVMPLETFTEK